MGLAHCEDVEFELRRVEEKLTLLITRKAVDVPTPERDARLRGRLTGAVVTGFVTLVT
jgi:predicted aminopeptidase